jgi:Smg protein
MKIGGHGFQPWIKYYFELDLQPARDVDADAVSSSARVIDWRVDLTKWDWASVRLGQWKVDLNRERSDSSGRQQFVERSIVNRIFTVDRQVGVQLRGRLFDGTLADMRYYAGVFNGEGRDLCSYDINHNKESRGCYNMKEDVLDVLMYLFETYIETEDEPEADQNTLRIELIKAGFNNNEIDKALDWLDGLAEHNENFIENNETVSATRIYNSAELNQLDTSCRGFISYLEQINILTTTQRELLIDRLLALNSQDINVDQIKWVVLMVLFSQPGQEKAYSQMEDLIFDTKSDFLH